VASNNRLERSRDSAFGKPRRELMIEINLLPAKLYEPSYTGMRLLVSESAK
jgi:hypothetical protein